MDKLCDSCRARLLMARSSTQVWTGGSLLSLRLEWARLSRYVRPSQGKAQRWKMLAKALLPHSL